MGKRAAYITLTGQRPCHTLDSESQIRTLPFCSNCWACGPAASTDEKAREYWNRMRTRVSAASTAPVVNCDYRNQTCAAYGVTIGGKWICNNHICEQRRQCWLSTKTLKTTAPTPSQPARDAETHKQPGSITERTIDKVHRETGIPIWALETAFELSTLGMLDEETIAGMKVISETARVIAADMDERITDARSTLAQKVIETVEGQREQSKAGRTDWINETERESSNQGVDYALSALRELFQREGIEVDSTST